MKKTTFFTELRKRYGMLHTKRFLLWFSLSISHRIFSIHNAKVSGYFTIQLLTSYMKFFVIVYRLSRNCSVTYFCISVDVKFWGQLFSKMAFFAFHQYLATNFLLNNLFCWELYSFPVCSSKWCISIFCFKYFISHPCFFSGCLCYTRNKRQYFTLMARKSFT